MRDAQIIYDNATAKLAENKEAMDKLVELADRVKLMRDWEEGQNSVDKLEYDLEQAFLRLADRVGRHRASEVVMKYLPKV